MACGKIPTRFIIFVMLCVVSIVNNIVRSNMSIVILAMTKPLNNITAEVPDYGPRYKWSAYDQSLVIGSFFWGQVIVLMFAGVFTERYGARRITGFGIIAAAIICIIAPLLARFLWLLITINFFIGIATGTTTAATQALISNWAPLAEKGKFQSSLLASGLEIVINWTMSGFIIKHFGWQYAFYTVGIILGLYASAWFFLVYDSPNNHPTISVVEKDFILSKLNKTTTKAKPWPPIRSILLSLPFWALVFLHFGHLFAALLFITAIPKYLSEVHHFSISATGVLSSIPYILRFPFSMAFGFVTDLALQKQIMRAAAIRKYFTIFSHFIPACCLISLTLVGDRPYVCVGLITLALGSSNAISVTALQNPHDLSPNLATTIFGFMHTIGSTPGFIAPMIVAHFTKEKNSENEWWYVFVIAASILAFAAITFVLFGSGKTQKWNNIPEKVNDEKEAQTFIEYPKFEKYEKDATVA